MRFLLVAFIANIKLEPEGIKKALTVAKDGGALTFADFGQRVMLLWVRC